MERERRSDNASDRQTRQSEHVESVGGSSAEQQQQHQLQPLQVADQTQESEGDNRMDEAEQLWRRARTTRRGDRSNIPTSQRTSAARMSGELEAAGGRIRNSVIEFVMAFERQPPTEIRTGIRLPPVVVVLRLLCRDLNGGQPLIDDSNLNAVAALVAPDGETPVIGASNSIIMRPMMATPQQQYPFGRDDIWWQFVFSPNEISISGFFKIQVIVMHRLVGDPLGDLDREPPFQLLRVTSRLIHVHPFAASG
ncbi:MAG: hypothetical protein Q9163_000480 [Psora crenata]